MKTTLQTPIRRLLAAASLLALSASLAAKPAKEHPSLEQANPAFAALPIYAQPVDPEEPDLGVDRKIRMIRHEKDSSRWHFEKGMALKKAANHLYNQARYREAHELYLKSETQLKLAAEKTRRGSKSELREAYFHLGLVCERVHQDKSVAASCFLKAHELDPENGAAQRKLLKTKEGRKRLDIDKAQKLSASKGRKSK